MPFHPVLDRRLVFVTGKGGVGKTTITAALARLAVRRRRRVLAVELTPHGRLRELLGGPEPGAEPVEVAPGLDVMRIDPRQALGSFLDGLLPLRALTDRLLASDSFSILTAAAPGIEEFLALSRLAELEAARSPIRRRPRYDLILVDAPASGHSLPLLSTARTLLEMVPLGPIRTLAENVSTLLADPTRSAAAVVAIPQEMAVNETIEIAQGIRSSRAIALGPIFVNAVWPRRFEDEEERWLLGPGGASSDPRVQLGRYHVEKRRREASEILRLGRAIAAASIELPFAIDDALERPALDVLVDRLEQPLRPPTREACA